MTTAAEVYEILLLDVGAPRRWWQKWSRRQDLPAGVIISVVHTETGDELFRHIEDIGDDDHLLGGIRLDLASMTAVEFAARWGR